MTSAEFHFDRIHSSLMNEIRKLDKIKIVNAFLKKNDWLFISPFFFQGYELESLLTLSKNPKTSKENVTRIIFRKFFKLEFTASFIEGYCKRCDHVEPFLLSIEHSLILSLQRDYEGAIKTLIPIIEGIIRRYLILEKGKQAEAISFKNIKHAFSLLKEDLIIKYRDGFKSYKDGNSNLVIFSDQQVENLVELEASLSEVWFSFLIDFINNSFYLNTNNQIIINELNRHAILHEYGLNVPYTLENYIKVYFVLQFLVWIFLQKEGKSILNKIETYRFFEKVLAYENILKYSKKLYFEKHLLYKENSKYSDETFHQNIETENKSVFPRSLLVKYKVIKRLQRLLWKKGWSKFVETKK